MSRSDRHPDLTADETLLKQHAGNPESAGPYLDPSSYFESWLNNLKLSSPDSEADASSNPIATDYRAENPREIKFEGTLRVDGYLAGVVSSAEGTLITTAGGEIDADISVKVAIIYGKVRGDIYAATRVELGGTARVIGDIETSALSLHPGAVFEGRCTFLPDPEEIEARVPIGDDSISLANRANEDDAHACEAIAAAAR